MQGVVAIESSEADRQPISKLVIIIFSALFIAEAVKLSIFSAAAPAFVALDAAGYWKMAEQVGSGDIWMNDHPVAHRTPGYPWFLGALKAVCGAQFWRAAVIIQYFIVFITSAATAWWTMRLTGRPWLAALALAICVLSAARPGYASVLLTETIFTLFFTLAVLQFTSLDQQRPYLSSGLSGVVWGTSWLIRPVAVVLVPAWLLSCWFSWCGSTLSSVPSDGEREEPSLTLRASLRRCLLCVVVTLSILGVMLAPWMMCNRRLFGRTSMTVFLGRELWLTTFGPGQPAAHPLPDSEASRRLKELVLQNDDFTAWNGNWTVSDRLTAAGLNDVEADELMRTVAIEATSADPARTIARGVWRSIDFWRSVYSRPMAFYDETSEDERLVDDATKPWSQPTCDRVRDAWLKNAWESRLIGVELTSLLALIGLAGMWLSPKTWKAGAVMTLAILGTAIASAAVEYPTYRYRMVLEPSMIVAAVTGWSVIVDVLRRGTRSLWQA